MKRQSKRGVSELVVTVLLVLITVAAVGVIYGAVMPIIKKGMETSTKCMDAQMLVNTEAGFTYCCDEGTYGGTPPVGYKNVSVQVRGPEKEVVLAGLQLKISDDTGNSKVYEQTSAPTINTDKVYRVDVKADLTGKPTTVGVAPILTIGETKHICPMATEVSIPAK